jgi:exodeoxyribonuclease III
LPNNNHQRAKILALNIRSGGGSRASQICQFLSQSQADVVVLTEWRANAVGTLFVEWAKSCGMSHAVLNDGNTHNGVFVASKHPFKTETQTPRLDTPGVLMMVRFANWVLVASYFPQSRAKAAFFAALINAAQEHSGLPFLIVGDLNTGNQLADKSPQGGNYHCAAQFDQLSTGAGLIDLWRHTNGAKAQEWTWLSRAKNGFRIDHAFANSRFVEAAQPTCIYDHSPRNTGITDHSALKIVLKSQL